MGKTIDTAIQGLGFGELVLGNWKENGNYHLGFRFQALKGFSGHFTGVVGIYRV